VDRLWETVVQKMHRCYTKSMLTDVAAIQTYFAKLGLESEIADIYLALHSYGPQTISELSRSSKVERTRIYRLIDKLLESNLVELESHYKRGIIKAAPIANLHILISQKEQELKSLQDELELIQQVLARNTLSNPATRVQSYRGPEGIRQMQWNLFRAKKEILSIMPDPMQSVTGDAFFKRWTDRWNQESDKICRILINNRFLTASNDWHKRNPGVVPKAMYSRLLSPKVFPITFAMDVYDDVVAYYNWHGGEVFGIEIYNNDIAAAQRAFYEMLWAKAKPLTPKDDLGRAGDKPPNSHSS
jgi:sugar-specific transcriptional regulator TrmB